MTSIPFDILMEILPLVETSDLLAMARTNRDLSDYALDRIYGHISSKNMKAACQSVSSNPSLAQRVRSLEINYSHGGHGYHLESILPSFRDALRVTLNLRTLKLDINGNHSWVLKPALGAFKLRSFSCYAYTDQDLLDFLRDQTELEEIMLSHSYTFIEHGAPIKFPALKKFHGPMTWADLIIPHEPVSHVEISYIGHGSPIASLGLSTAPIRHLRIPIHAVDKRQPRELKVLFPALKNLVLTVSQTLVLRLVSDTMLRDLLESFSTVQDFGILGYHPQHEEGHDIINFVKTVTEKAPAVRRFHVRYIRRAGFSIIMRTVRLRKEVNGWHLC